MKIRWQHTALAACFGVCGLIVAQPQASARDWDDHYHMVQKCDHDGDRCAIFRCDADGDRCVRTSGWRQRRSDWDEHYRYSGYYQDRDHRGFFTTKRCDADGDRCVTVRCDRDGDRCETITR